MKLRIAIQACKVHPFLALSTKEEVSRIFNLTEEGQNFDITDVDENLVVEREVL